MNDVNDIVYMAPRANVVLIWEGTNSFAVDDKTKTKAYEEMQTYLGWLRVYSRHYRMKGKPRGRRSSMRKRRSAYYAFTKPKYAWGWKQICALPSIPREGVN